MAIRAFGEQRPVRGEVWVSGSYRVLVTSAGIGRVGFVRLNGAAKGGAVRCDLAQFLAAYSLAEPDGSER